jgi:uncharacterized protein YcgI (DUF1989 family)
VTLAAPALETYRVQPGSVTAIRVHPGDHLDVIDQFGRQPAELTVLSANPGAVPGARPDAPATVLQRLVPGDDEDGYAARRILGMVASYGVVADEARATRLFDGHTRAGALVGFDVDDDAVLLLAAPAVPMQIDSLEPNPPSELWVHLRRADPTRMGPVELPAPLAEPLLDMRIDASTALDYQVKAGQFIQIIDVEGRQCSDFLAFDARALQDGREFGLDATTTRTIVGSAYPQPGLRGKFFDARGAALVEVVRDTVGRHDTFGLACNAKYYEDMGYPGHINCTDNFNAALSTYGVRRRTGWPALNLFYNTAFDAAHQLVTDEPWSRAGDYVLLRATADLVCASIGLPGRHRSGQRLDSHRYPCARLRFDQEVLRGAGPSRHPGCRDGADQEDRLRVAHRTVDPALHRVRRLLATQHLRGPRGAAGVLGLPGAGRCDGSVGTAQVRGAGPRRRGIAAVGAHPRCPTVVPGAGGVFGDVYRHRWHDGRLHALPVGRQQFPLCRWATPTTGNGYVSRQPGVA